MLILLFSMKLSSSAIVRISSTTIIIISNQSQTSLELQETQPTSKTNKNISYADIARQGNNIQASPRTMAIIHP